MIRRRITPPTVEREVDEELAHHVAMIARDLVAEGWDEHAAWAEAERRFGDVERVKARCRDLGARRDEEMGGRLGWDVIRQDLRYALRQLRRAPAFAALTVLTLGLAIGANTAVFSVVHAVLLRPLPYPDADRLAVVWTRYLPPSGFDLPKFQISGPELLDLVESMETFETLGAFVTRTRIVTGDSPDAERIRVGVFSDGVADALGVQPALGRWFSSTENQPDGPELVVLSHAVWTDRYGADADVLGRTILLDGIATEVVGVMPEGFAFPAETQAWLPMRLGRSNEGGRAGHGLSAVGRLAPGRTLEELDAELALIAEQWAAEHEHNVAHFPWAQSLRAELVADAPARLILLMSAVGLVLLIACANVANLLLARAERRHAEVAVRTTLGAGRGRITGQLATESLVLAGLAALLGCGLALIGTRALVAIDPDALPRLDGLSVNGPVLVFTTGVTLLTALLFGVVPAYLTGKRAAPSLASSASRTVGSRRSRSLRRLLVAGEVALSLVVVILAGLVVRSFSALTSVDPRMETENLLRFSVTLPSASYPEDDRISGELEILLDGIRAVPGVTSATAGTTLPFSGRSQWDFQLDDRPPRRSGDMAWNAGIAQVATDYFETLGIPLLDGRGFASTDARGAPLVAVASETLASRYWPGEHVVGKRIGYQMEDSVPWMTIVGLVPDPVAYSLSEEPYPHLYVPHGQAGVSTYFVPRAVEVAVRGGVPVETLLSDIRGAVAAFDPDVPIYRVAAFDEVVDDSLASSRVVTTLLGLFAVIALVLAVVGVYGVISYSVASRTREIGVRVALGAERREITRLILGEGARPVAAGIAIGVGVALGSSRLVESMLYGVEAVDPLTFSVLPAGLLALGVVASLVPALRATGVAPTEALREE